MKREPATPKKFWNQVEILGDDDCWNFKGPTNNGGYGYTRLGKFHTTAHRIAWIITYGETANGLEVSHKCSNKLCCNPVHLYLSTRSENMRELYERGKYVYPNYSINESIMPCGHSSRYVVSSDEGTNNCLMCEYLSLSKFTQEIKSVYQKHYPD